MIVLRAQWPSLGAMPGYVQCQERGHRQATCPGCCIALPCHNRSAPQNRSRRLYLVSRVVRARAPSWWPREGVGGMAPKRSNAAGRPTLEEQLQSEWRACETIVEEPNAAPALSADHSLHSSCCCLHGTWLRNCELRRLFGAVKVLSRPLPEESALRMLQGPTPMADAFLRGGFPGAGNFGLRAA